MAIHRNCNPISNSTSCRLLLGKNSIAEKRLNLRVYTYIYVGSSSYAMLRIGTPCSHQPCNPMMHIICHSGKKLIFGNFKYSEMFENINLKVDIQ